MRTSNVCGPADPRYINQPSYYTWAAFSTKALNVFHESADRPVKIERRIRPMKASAWHGSVVVV